MGLFGKNQSQSPKDQVRNNSLGNVERCVVVFRDQYIGRATPSDFFEPNVEHCVVYASVKVCN